MTAAAHTIRHAIDFLQRAMDECMLNTNPYQRHPERDALREQNPIKPCAAYGVAVTAFRRSGSLSGAIADLQRSWTH